MSPTEQITPPEQRQTDSASAGAAEGTGPAASGEETRPLASQIDTPAPLPLPKPAEAIERYERAFAQIQPPFAFLDLDAVWANASDMLRRSRGKPIRIVSGSIRSRPVLQRLLALDPGFQGTLCFTLAEALWLWEQDLRNLVVAYPTSDRACLTRLGRITAEDPEQAPVVMVDSAEHLDLIEEAVSSFVAPVRVAIDVDLSWRPLRGLIEFGAGSSPVRTAEQALELAREIEQRDRVKLVGIQAYEPQIAEVPDNLPGKGVTNLITRAKQSASAKELAARREEIVGAISDAYELEFVNGGGTGSIERSAAEWPVTEIAAGSGFYTPTALDHYRSFRLRPGALFTLPLTRPAGGLRFDHQRGSETAAPIRGPGVAGLELGDRVYFRHRRAGEISEQFDRLYLLAGTTIRDEVPTYRGEGRAFG